MRNFTAGSIAWGGGEKEDEGSDSEILKPLPEGDKASWGEGLATHLTFYSFPELDEKKAGSANRTESPNREIRRRTLRDAAPLPAEPERT